MEPITVVHISKFLAHNAQPIPMSEMQTFWKSLSEEEKQDYRNSVAKWDVKSTYIS